MKKILKKIGSHLSRNESVYVFIFALVFCSLVAYWWWPFAKWMFGEYYDLVYAIDLSYTKNFVMFIVGSLLLILGIIALGIMALIVLSGVMAIIRIINAFVCAKNGERIASCIKQINKEF